MLPRNTTLGPLEVLEMYEYYDGPRLFAAENAAGHKYLCVWLGDKGAEERWLYAPVSESRLRSLRAGTFELRRAFTEPEGKKALRIQIDRTNGTSTVDAVEGTELPDAELPVSGEKLNECCL